MTRLRCYPDLDSAFAARKADLAIRNRELPGELIFEVSSFLRRSLTDPGDSETLYRRLRNFVNSKRRGSLRLPSHFPAKVRALSKLSKTHIRQYLSWARPETGLVLPLSKRQYEFVKHHSDVTIWNRWSDADHHTANVVGLPRLRKTDAPAVGRRLWPSAPSFTEMLGMIRSGVPLTSGHKYRPSYTVKCCITRKDLSDSIRLATKIVAKNIIGIRSSIEIPEKFTPWFRHRFGFSILSVRHNIPSGLVRFLLAQWKVRPSNLWLLDHCSLKIFLRKHWIHDFVGDFRRKPGFGPEPPCLGVSSPSTASPPPQVAEDAIARLMRRLHDT
jgi:hypothetical protein